MTRTAVSIPICCVTGRIAGDGFACGDCDPCGAAHAVPDAVKRLIVERDEWMQKFEDAMTKPQHAPEKPDPRDGDPTRKGIFFQHACWRCKDGDDACVRGDPRRCDFLRARND